MSRLIEKVDEQADEKVGMSRLIGGWCKHSVLEDSGKIMIGKVHRECTSDRAGE